ncbi:MAG: hypothetical protein KBF29_06110, partial [Sterolibacterium sp.]|nr:hypothetical protein [Sterolibacterium sp.]
AAVLIGPNREWFGCKPHTTNLKKPALRWLFLYPPQTPLLARVWTVSSDTAAADTVSPLKPWGRDAFFHGCSFFDEWVAAQ